MWGGHQEACSSVGWKPGGLFWCGKDTTRPVLVWGGNQEACSGVGRTPGGLF